MQLPSGRKGKGLHFLEYFADVLDKANTPICAHYATIANANEIRREKVHICQ